MTLMIIITTVLGIIGLISICTLFNNDNGNPELLTGIISLIIIGSMFFWNNIYYFVNDKTRF